jgi:hypothetical protein
MSLSATATAVPHEPAETRKLLLLIWGIAVATYLLTGRGADHGLSTDDAMRLVQVRDLLAGQGWFDLTQYRLNPPDGVPLHWSRLIDLPIAILLRAAELVLAPAAAERLVLTVWPAALLLVFLFGVVRIARELADDSAARLALMFAVMTAPLLQHFRPGAIDHHGAQLALMLWSVALTIRERASVAVQKFAVPSGQNGSELLNQSHTSKPSSARVPLNSKFATECAAESSELRIRDTSDAAIAGACCALSLAIGQEMAPAIAAVAGFVAVCWIVRGDASRHYAAAFGMAFAAGTLVLFAATVPPARYTAASCDALSIVQLVIAMAGGFGLAILTAWRALSTMGRRVAGAAGLGVLLAATVAIGFPACLGDPYGNLDPRLAALWLSNVNEARSIVSLMRDLPQEVLPYYGLPVVALVLGLYRCRHESGARQWGWIGATAVMTVTTLVAIWQVRGSAAANALALGIVAAAIVRGLPAPEGGAIFFGLGRSALLAALVVSPVALIAAGKAVAWTATKISGAQQPVVISDGPGTCRAPADYAPLARLPKGLVLAFIDAGPMILMETTHSALAAPFHRNLAGNAAMFDVFLGSPEKAGARLAARGIDYVAFCPGSPERHNYAAAAPEGLAAALARGEIPQALERIPLEGTDLMIFRRR